MKEEVFDEVSLCALARKASTDNNNNRLTYY